MSQPTLLRRTPAGDGGVRAGALSRAMIFQDGAFRGAFSIEVLSAEVGIFCGPQLAVTRPARVSLRMDGQSMHLDAKVVGCTDRTDRYELTFIVPPGALRQRTHQTSGLPRARVLRTPTVLVLDDSPEVQFALRHDLGRLGCRMITATSVRQARQCLRIGRRRFDFVLLDALVARADEGGFLREVAREHPEIRRVLMADCIRESELLSACPGEADALLNKPWAVHELADLIRGPRPSPGGRWGPGWLLTQQKGHGADGRRSTDATGRRRFRCSAFYDVAGVGGDEGAPAGCEALRRLADRGILPSLRQLYLE